MQSNLTGTLRRASRKTKAVIAAGVIVIGGAIGSTVAFTGAGAATTTPGAVTPVGTSEFTVCAKDSNGDPVRIYAKKAGCSAGYHANRWEAQGTPGTPGKDGKDGTNGTNGTDGKNAIESLTQIPATTTPVTLHNVGGSIRAGVTDLGATVLPDAGAYDVKVLATFFRKVNTSSNPEWANKQTYGTLVVWTGNSINADFSNDTTVGGVLIPKVNSTTLTIDPSANLSATITTTAPDTPVHVGVFAYDDDSSSTGTTGQPGEGTFSAALQSASFEQLNVG